MKVHYSYTQIHDSLCILAKRLVEEHPGVDYIVAIGGGGLIPARIMRATIDVPLLVISLKLYNDTSKYDGVQVIQWLDKPEIIKGKHILIVDEVNDTGETLNYCVNKLREHQPSEIGVAVIHHKNKQKHSEVNSDYYDAAEYIEDNWIVYPWE